MYINYARNIYNMQWLVKSNTLFHIHIEYKKTNHKKKQQQNKPQKIDVDMLQWKCING